MRTGALLSVLALAWAATAADLESRVLTHYVPQDLLQKAVRTEGWTEIPLDVKGGVRKGDVVRLWTGGSIDRGNGDYPGQYAGSPCGPEPASTAAEVEKLALSPDPTQAYALLFKTEVPELKKALPQGQPLEITLTKDKERLFVGFNDERGRYQDNYLGKGRRHELDPLWIRVEVVRTVVD